MKKKRGNSQADTNKRIFTERSVIRLMELVASTTQRLFTTCMVIGTAYLIATGVRDATKNLAGKETNADINANLSSNILASFSVNEWAAWAVAVFASGWGLTERRLRKRRTAELAKSKKQLEEAIALKRTSSSLPPSGDTRLEDKP